MTTELFFQWKKKKMEERDAGLAAQQAERAKNDRMRFLISCMLHSVKENVFKVVLIYISTFSSGRELFLSDSSWFVDDIDAEAYEKYQKEEETKVAEQKVILLLLSPPKPYMMCNDG